MTNEAQEKSKLRRVGCFFGRGIISDLKTRIPKYPSDIKDGIHFHSLGAILFMVFASIAPALSFGSFLALRTENQLGVTEVLLSTAICGIAFSVFGGQPLIVVGVTGPVVIFTVTVFDLAKTFQIPFLPWLSVIGFWAAGMHVILAVVNASMLIRKVTRFTTEIFGVLIALIYLITAVQDIIYFFEHTSIDGALLATMIAVATFWLAYTLNYAHRWRYLPVIVRKLLSDYAVAISIIIVTGLSYLPKLRDVKINYLPLPPTFGLTPARDWIVDYTSLPVWSIFAAIIPALVLTCLFFFDHNVSSLLSQKKEFNLKKGTAFDWDFFVVGLMISACGVISIPYTNGLIPQAPLHVRSLATIKSTKTPRGETVEVWTYVRENRITNLMHALLIGVVTIWGQPALQLIPQSVMTGLFIFMGLTSFDGNQFADRVKLLFMHPNSYPHNKYTLNVKFRHIVGFTIIQTICFAIILGITESPASLAFPIFIILLMPFRSWILPKIFSKEILSFIDSDDIAQEPPSESNDAATATTSTAVADTATGAESKCVSRVDSSIDIGEQSTIELPDNAKYHAVRTLSDSQLSTIPSTTQLVVGIEPTESSVSLAEPSNTNENENHV